MRLIEYDEGGYIAPHFDGPRYDPNTKRESTITFLLYLEDTDDSGCTNFLSREPNSNTDTLRFRPSMATSSQGTLEGPSGTGEILREGDGWMLHESADILASIQPRAGSILLFPHELWHEGAITSDSKILLRGEIF
jgi:hypothetical protein